MARRLRPTDTIIELSRSDLLKTLTGIQLVVFIRILGAVGRAGGKPIEISNRDLYDGDTRSVVAALRKLEDEGLIVITRDKSTRAGRTIFLAR